MKSVYAHRLTAPMVNIPRNHHIHFVGIGGAGMSGIAEVLHQEGYTVSGSDIAATKLTERLKALGITIYHGHHETHSRDAHVVVFSSAVASDNPELLFAYQQRIPVIKRAQMLGELMRLRYGIAVAGTHGKTTTTALIAHIYQEAGWNPSVINGGLIKSTGSHAQLGSGQTLIVEADESDGSFIHLHPMLTVITNIEPDHLEHYNQDIGLLQKAFVGFLDKLPFYGTAILCVDDPIIRNNFLKINRRLLTYGFSKDADINLSAYEQRGGTGSFTIHHADKPPLKVRLNLPGKHNALNAAAAIAAAQSEGIADTSIQAALASYQGTQRRFEHLGERQLPNGTVVTVIDDYGHHPTELQVTMDAIRDGWPSKRVVMVFQPHRYSRTRSLFEPFVNVLRKPDTLVLLETYSAGEPIIPTATTEVLAQTLQKEGKKVLLPTSKEPLLQQISSILQADDLLLIQGAGNIAALVDAILEAWPKV